MKHIILTCLLFIGAMASPPLTEPANAQTQTESLRDMANWMQSAMTIQTDMMSLFSADSMNNMYSVINTEDVAEIQRLGQQFEAERQAVLARASSQIENLAPPEKWNVNRSIFSNQDRVMFKAAQNQYKSLHETYSLFDTLTGSLSEILNDPASLDDSALESMINVQYQASVKLIELENQQIDGYLAAIPKENPNHQFQKIVKQFNLAAIPEMKIAMLASNLEERRVHGEAMGEELEPIRSLIREGRRNAKKEIKKIELITRSNLSAEERAMMPIIIELYENFDEAFEVEGEILDSMKSSYKLYISEKSDAEIESQVEENDIEFFRLVESRAELMQYRLSLLQ